MIVNFWINAALRTRVLHRSRTFGYATRIYIYIYTRVSTLICLSDNNVSRFVRGGPEEREPVRESSTQTRVVWNSVDTEISRFQLNLAESNFTGPMCISGLMHSIPAGPEARWGGVFAWHYTCAFPSLLSYPNPYPNLFNPISNYTCNTHHESSCAQVIIILPSYQRYCHSWSHTTIALFEVLRLVAIDQRSKRFEFTLSQSACSLKRRWAGGETWEQRIRTIGDRLSRPPNILLTRTKFIPASSLSSLSFSPSFVLFFSPHPSTSSTLLVFRPPRTLRFEREFPFPPAGKQNVNK